MTKKKLTFYHKESDVLNTVKSIFKRKVDYFILKLDLVNSFRKNKDDWTLEAVNYAKIVEFKMIMPEELTIKEVKFYRRNKSEEFEELDTIQPIIKKEYGRDSFFIKLSDFDQNQMFKVQWKLKKTTR